MAIISYNKTTNGAGNYLSKNSSVFSYHNVLYALGDYWIDYFKNSEMLKGVLASTIQLSSVPYLQLLNNVFYTTLVDAPIDSINSYYMFVFSKNSLVYDDTQQAYKVPFNEIEVYSSNGREYISNIKSIDNLANGLVSPTVILDHNEHYKVDSANQYIYLYVDLFGDPNISDQTYKEQLNNSDEYLVLWGSNISFFEKTLYERFGRFIWGNEINSEDYSLILQILQFFFVNAKSISSFEVVINALFGIPIARYYNEVVQDISAYTDSTGSYNKVTTDRWVYYVPSIASLSVKVGDVLSKFQLLGKFLNVYDWYTDWYKNSSFPWDLCENTTLTQWKYNGKQIHDGSIRYGFPSYLKSMKPQPQINILEVDNILELDNVLFEETEDGYYGIEEEFYLYNLLDTILKYNIIKIEAKVNSYVNISGDIINNIKDILRQGTPVYIYPFVELSFDYDMEEGIQGADLGDTLLYSPDVVADVRAHGYYYYGKESRDVSIYVGELEKDIDGEYIIPYTDDVSIIYNLLADSNKNILYCDYPLDEDIGKDDSDLDFPGISHKHPRVIRHDARIRYRGEYIQSHSVFK